MNLYYFLLCGGIAAVSAVVAALIGGAAFGGIFSAFRNSRHVHRVATPVALAAALLACVLTGSGLVAWAIYWEDHNPSIPAVQPATADLTGIWLPASFTLSNHRPADGYANPGPSLTLAADGTFDLVNFPLDWVEKWTATPPSAVGVVSGAGRWQVVNEPDRHWLVTLQFTSVTSDKLPALWSFYLRQDKSGYYLFDYLSDPDSGDMIKLERSD